MIRLHITRGFYMVDFGTPQVVHAWLADAMNMSIDAATEEENSATEEEKEEDDKADAPNNPDHLKLSFIHQGELDGVDATDAGQDLRELRAVVTNYDAQTHFVVQMTCTMPSSSDHAAEQEEDVDSDFLETFLIPFFPLAQTIPHETQTQTLTADPVATQQQTPKSRKRSHLQR